MRPTETIALRREPGHLIRSLVALLLRGGLGMIFLMAGLSKFNDMARPAPPLEVAEIEIDDPSEVVDPEDDSALDPANATVEAEAEADDDLRYPETIRGRFADTWLARDLGPALNLQTALLPYVEVAVGVLLIVGLFTTLTAFLSGLLLLSLTFGLTVLQESSLYPNMMVYLLVNAGILWLSPITSNYLSLDGLLFGWFLKPKDEGEYRREYEAPIR